MRKWPDVHARYEFDEVDALIGKYDTLLRQIADAAGGPDEEPLTEALNFIGHQLAREVPALREEVGRWRAYQLGHAGHVVPEQREAAKPEPVVVYEAA